MASSQRSRSPIVEYAGLPESTAPPVSTRAATVVGTTSQSRHNDDSWVEVASQPSSSSVSSIGDDIVTTGLQVGAQSYPPRRRRLQHQHRQQSVQQHMPLSYIVSHAAAQAGTSSQDEYDETESEEDHLMTSSTENIRPTTGTLGLPRSPTALGPSPGVDLSDSEDDDGTALGRPTGFRPQPNAFSHPPAYLSHRTSSSNSSIPTHHPGIRPSTYTHRSHNRPRTGFVSPVYQADNDAALRASLTTLLSCAAAAKNLPGRPAAAAGSSPGEPVMGAGVGTGTQPMELRLVAESEVDAGGSPALGPPAPKPSPRVRQPTTRTTSNSSARSAPASTSSEDKAGRAAYAGQPRYQRATRKKRTAAAAVVDDGAVTWISPTTLTWVVGTGVVLLISVVGFGAGFVVGREVGRQDVLSSMSGGGGGGAPAPGPGANASSCGGEVIRSTSGGTLKRWRWGSGMTSLVSA